MSNYSFYPTLLNDFSNYKFERMLGESFMLCNENQLIDKLNRVPYPQTEPMLRGIAFEKALQNKIYKSDGFEFEMSVIDEMIPLVEGGFWQTFVECEIMVDGHRVRLYGYIDVVRRNQCIDTKTTKQYEWPKFKDCFQHHVYLLGANSCGILLNHHQYLVTDFKHVYKEDYFLDVDLMTGQLQNICRDLIFFIEAKRHLIYNEKLFA